MDLKFERDDSGIRVHERGVIAQLCSLFRSHEQGLPEWFKNASTAYARENLPTEQRILTLLVGDKFIALLDHVGMSVEDLEQRFANWGDPEAHLSASSVAEPLEGGHGNGGKCYMTQMFEHYSYIQTVRNKRGSRYGFVADDPHSGYFPDRATGRGFPVERAVDELRRSLAEIGVDFSRLPDEVKTVAAQRSGFTLVVGIGPKQFRGKDAGRKLMETVVHHPQMVVTTQKNRIFVVVDGRPLAGSCPITLPEIEPHDFAPEPRVIPIPGVLKDPVTDEKFSTTPHGLPEGMLILRTSKVSMRWSHKGRHHLRYLANGRPIAFLRMENVSRSTWVDKMYGECSLDVLREYETPDRSVLADAPLTRALENWIKEQILQYEEEFKKREHLSASSEQRKKLRDLNDLLDRWKNKFLEDVGFGTGGVGAGEGERPKPPRRPLPQIQASKVTIGSPFSKAGIGVWLRMRVDFTDANGERVAPPPYLWYSSDWAVATVDENRVVTHTPGKVEVWLETADGRLRSQHLEIDVIDIERSRIEPATITLCAGQVLQLKAIVTDRAGHEHSDAFLTWLQDDSSIVHVTPSGRVMAQKQGATQIYAVDERCMNHALPCEVEVLPAQVPPGSQDGRSYPRILLSEVDEDPLNPDGETVHLSPEDGPVHQPTPQHVQSNIWWINLQCPLAKLYFEGAGPESAQWRSYHIERYIEVLVKIRLALDFQVAEEELTFDEIERRWREIAAEVQRRALIDLRPLLEGQEIEA